jgi:hypothetical protein
MSTQRAIREYQDNSPSWDEYYAEQLHRAERYVPTHKMEMDLPVPSLWQIIKDDFRVAPLHQRIGFALFAGFGIGVTVALIGGWL